MIDISKIPTASDLAYKTDKAKSAAEMFAEFAATEMIGVNSEREDIDRLIDAVIILRDMLKEIDMMAQVLCGDADYSFYFPHVQIIKDNSENT